MWKHILGVLIKWPWHLLGTYYSYPVAFIISALEVKTPQALTGISTLCTNSMETLTPKPSPQLATHSY